MFKKIQLRIYNALENPQNIWEKSLTLGLLILIFLSVLLMAFEQARPDLYARYDSYFEAFDYFAFVIFGFEYLIRILVWPNPLKYIFSFEGLVDLVAILPRILGGFDSGFIRGLRLFRFLRVLKIFNLQKSKGVIFGNTILAKVLPFLFISFVIKLIVFLLETNGWWIEVGNLETIFAVIGFAIGVVLTQKLGIAYGKIIVVEDAIIKVVGTLKSLQYNQRFSALLKKWSLSFADILNNKKDSQEAFESIHENLGLNINQLSEGSGKLFAQESYQTLCQESAFIFNRMAIETDPVYELFLKRVTIFYAFMLIIFLPGFIGLVSVLFAAYVLGGLYFVIDDMDRAIGFEFKNLINADTSEIETLNQKWSTSV